MKYRNPVIPGFYPDPSVVRVKEKYYLVTSSFEYFPAVPIFESNDLINWKQIGSVLDRKSQVNLKDTYGKRGIFAPTIRYNDGKYYVVTTNVTHGGNFLVTTTDPYRSWSEPIYIKQGGIDPSLFFEKNKSYFISTAQKNGKNAILASEINLKTGDVTNSHYIWFGYCGKNLEGPHLYKINGCYYLLASEGGTEYGHMLVVARSKNIWGPYENCPENPILTNRNLDRYPLQGTGHGDFVEDVDGKWWVVFLGFRRTTNGQFHTLGREVNLLPVKFENGWPVIGNSNKIAQLEITTDRNIAEQHPIPITKLETATIGQELVFLRNPNIKKYDINSRRYILYSTSKASISNRIGSPTAIFTRQRSFTDDFSVNVKPGNTKSGITVYQESDQHYDLLVKKVADDIYQVEVRLVIGPAISHPKKIKVKSSELNKIGVTCTSGEYIFYVIVNNKRIKIGSYTSRFLSTEIAANFTGVMFGMFVEPQKDKGKAIFSNMMRR